MIKGPTDVSAFLNTVEMRVKFISWIFIFLAIGYTLATTLYKRVIPETHQGLGFKIPIDGFPKTVKSLIACGAITAALMKDPSWSTSKMDYANMFHYAEDGVCNPVKLPAYGLGNAGSLTEVQGSGWYYHQGCQFKPIQSTAEIVAEMQQGNLVFYFPATGDSLFYQNTTTTLQALDPWLPSKFPTYGTPFINGRSSFRAQLSATISDYSVKYIMEAVLPMP